jgi:hypothetical protein
MKREKTAAASVVALANNPANAADCVQAVHGGTMVNPVATVKSRFPTCCNPADFSQSP